MRGAGMVVESVKGECNFGQHEIAFFYGTLVDKCDEHGLFKLGAKEIAAQEGYSLTFMAKYDAREGNSCHIHLSLRDENDRPVFAGDGPHGFSPVFEHFLAGLLAYSKEFSLLLAPNINSYKRFVAGSFAPTALLWGVDNRTCAFRVVGHGPSIRVECRIPGGDVNPYLAVAALVAAGLRGVDEALALAPRLRGQRLRRRRLARADLARRGDRRSSTRARWRVTPSVTRSLTITCTRRASKSTRSVPPSPTGNVTEGSNDYEHALDHQPVDRGVIRTVEMLDVRRRPTRPSRALRRSPPLVAGGHAGRPGASAAPIRRGGRQSHRRARPTRGRQLGPHDR